MRKLEELDFDNTYGRRLPEAFYSWVTPTTLTDPYLVSFNAAAAELIDLDPREFERPDFAEYFSGSKPFPKAEPLAMLYAGHQFGSYVPQLGDGRAILLGEVRNRRGEKWDLQLKGAGPTPYSRGFDGRAVLRSTIREYLCSEAMHGLNIPTTRALSIVGSNEKVYRESAETAAVLLRMAPTHIRFGTFEVFYYRNQHEHVRQLADYVIEQFFPALIEAEDRDQKFLTEVVERTARLIAGWQAAGFAHGVMNTDNMSILGITLDYGPFGFLDDYDAGFICNHSDDGGRYAFDRQPAIGFWNLACLAQTLTPFIPHEAATAALDAYRPAFAEHYGKLMRAKLGLREERPDDAELLLSLFEILQSNQVDYAGFFRALGDLKQGTGERNDAARDKCTDTLAFDEWAARYRERLLSEDSNDAERQARMNRVNPKYILRNYLAQQAIDMAVERRDYSEINRLLALLQHPFDEQPEMERYADPPPNLGRKIVVSCSS